MSYRRKKKRLTRRRVLGGLLLCSVVGWLLPPSLTGRLMNLLQVFVPLQDASERTFDALAEAARAAGKPPPTSADWRRMVVENRALQHAVASLQVEVGALRASKQELAGLRGRGMRGRLIPARVVGHDVLAWRASELVDAGTLRGVRRDAAVISDHFALDQGTAEGLRSGLAVLTSEAYLGTIEDVGTHTARVKLVSDPTTRMAVQIARDRGDAFVPLDAAFWLVGRGRGRAQVVEVDHRYIKNDMIAVDDWVLTEADDTRLPLAMVIGRISEIRVEPGNALLYTLEVTLPLQPADLRHVYVVDPVGE